MQQLLVVLLMRLEGLKVDFRTKAKDEFFLRYLIVFGCEHQLYFDLYLEKRQIERSKNCNGQL
jgi:hypothetical protein